VRGQSSLSKALGVMWFLNQTWVNLLKDRKISQEEGTKALLFETHLTNISLMDLSVYD
jgi:hypothetical protein